VERGIPMCLGRHLVPVLTTWFRIRWSYAHRVRDVAAWVSGIAKASPLMAHLANKYFNDISHADVANTKCERSAHTAGMKMQSLDFAMASGHHNGSVSALLRAKLGFSAE
jgi:hypothetical protein